MSINVQKDSPKEVLGVSGALSAQQVSRKHLPSLPKNSSPAAKIVTPWRGSLLAVKTTGPKMTKGSSETQRHKGSHGFQVELGVKGILSAEFELWNQNRKKKLKP